MVSQMESLESLGSAELIRHQRKFEYGTEEWWEIQGILLYRVWYKRHGATVAGQMRAQWLRMNLERQQFDSWYGQQLELDL